MGLGGLGLPCGPHCCALPPPPPLQELPALLLEATKELEAARQQVLKRIQIWKRQQQLAGNGALFEENLTPLQKRWGGGGGHRGTHGTPPTHGDAAVPWGSGAQGVRSRWFLAGVRVWWRFTSSCTNR